MRIRQFADLYGLTVLTAAFAVLTAIAGVMNAPLGVALGVVAAVTTATVDVVTRYRRQALDQQQVTDALTGLGEAASRFRKRIVGGPSFGGTSVLEGALEVDLARLGQLITAGTFDFRAPDRWRQWGELGAALRSGATEFVLAANSLHHLPAEERRRAHALGEDAKRAAKYARAVGSAYANYDLDEDPPVARYRAEDVTVDLSMLAAYRSCGVEITAVAAELDTLESRISGDARAAADVIAGGAG